MTFADLHRGELPAADPSPEMRERMRKRYANQKFSG